MHRHSHAGSGGIGLGARANEHVAGFVGLFASLKQAMGLLENVFNKELLLSSDQVTDLFDVIRDYTYALDTLDAYDYQSLKIADTTAPERFHGWIRW